MQSHIWQHAATCLELACWHWCLLLWTSAGLRLVTLEWIRDFQIFWLIVPVTSKDCSLLTSSFWQTAGTFEPRWRLTSKTTPLQTWAVNCRRKANQLFSQYGNWQSERLLTIAMSSKYGQNLLTVAQLNNGSVIMLIHAMGCFSFPCNAYLKEHAYSCPRLSLQPCTCILSQMALSGRIRLADCKDVESLACWEPAPLFEQE